MFEQKPVTLDTVLYAQALQIALTLDGKPFNYNAMNLNLGLVAEHLNAHRTLANIIFDYLHDRNQS